MINLPPFATQSMKNLQDARQIILPKVKEDCVHHVNLQIDHLHALTPKINTIKRLVFIPT